jgi:hypothetical protein
MKAHLVSMDEAAIGLGIPRTQREMGEDAVHQVRVRVLAESA